MAENANRLRRLPARGNHAAEDLAVPIGYHISDAARLGRIVFDSALRPIGVTHSQSWVLGYLAAKEGIAQSELATRLGIGKVALGGLVDRLEAAGLVERRPDESDRRVKRIFLTGEGRKAILKIRETAEPIHDGIFEGITEKDLRVAARVLKAMKANLLGMLKNGE